MLHGVVLGVISISALVTFFFPKAASFYQDEPAQVSGLSVPAIGGSQDEGPVLTSSVLTTTIDRDEQEDGLLALSGQPPTAQPADDDEADAPPFELYVVVDGDTASSIAARFGIDIDYLLMANPDLPGSDFITVGQVLIIPPGNGALYYVRYGETLSDVAARYGVSVDDILAWQQNGLGSADAVQENQLVFVPGAIPYVPAAAEPTAVPTDPPAFVDAPVPTSPPPVAASEPPPAPVASSGLIWPVYGPISSYMDGSHPLGIDIDLYNAPGAAIVAATSGTVTFAGGSACCSYGLYVVIMSPDGIETLYAHLSGISVSAGQTVGQGEVIGYGGCTGYCTGNHLHFEVIDNGVRVNPLNYLP
jgi:murein DD-endopeptidase MepM/ murein hydrolase activator NlpD